MRKFEIHESSDKDGNSIPSKGEERVAKILSIMEIRFEREKIFEELKFRKCLRFDFHLPDYKLLIEFQGKQHYSAYEPFGGDSALREQQYRDELKKEFCNKAGLRLLLINYNASDVEIFEFLNEFLFKGKTTYKYNLWLGKIKDPEVEQIDKQPKARPRGLDEEASIIRHEFVQELLPEFLEYEQLTIHKYCRTGQYNPDRNLYEKVKPYVNSRMHRYDELRKELGEEIWIWHIDKIYSSGCTMADTVWCDIFTAMTKVEEHNLLEPRARAFFDNWFRHIYYHKNILGIDKRLHKLQRRLFKIWKANRKYYQEIVSRIQS